MRARTRRALLGAALLLGAAREGTAAGLSALYDAALEHDATLAAARSDLDAAAQGLPLARSALLPQLGASAAVTRNRLESGGLSDSFDERQWQVQLSQSLLDRASAALVTQADLGVAQAEAEFDGASQELRLRVANAYIEALRAGANLAFARAELDAIGRQLDQAEGRFDIGLAQVTDVRAARAGRDLAAAQRIGAANALASAREALRTLTGLEIETLDVLAPDLPLRPPEPDDIETWVARATQASPDLRIARRAAERAGAQIDVERGARWPVVELVASAGESDSDQRLRTDATTSARVGVQATLPLYTGGRTGARIAQARANLDASTDRVAGAERVAAQRARDGYRAVIAAIRRAQALRRALVSTERSAEAIESGFRAGTRTSLDVLQSLRDVTRARSDLANARHDYVLGTLQLEAAVGSLDAADLEAVDRFLVPPGSVAPR